MWVLTPQPGVAGDVQEHYLVPSDRAYSVGRKDNDILISNDKSISRQHATLSIRVDEGGESTLWVTGAMMVDSHDDGSHSIHRRQKHLRHHR